MKTLFLGFAGLALCAACGAPAPKPDAGTAMFRFALSDSTRSSPALKTSPIGTVYGNLFLSEDVGVTGPRDGAEGFGAVQVPSVDVSQGTSNASFVTPELPTGRYVFLGFLDVNGDGAQTRSPDTGDPVTLALTNQFDIVAGEQTKRAVLFELIFN